MRAPRPLAAALLGLAAAGLIVAATQHPALRHVYPDRLPEGEGQAIAERSCLMCHAATLITQQAKDSTAWEKTLGQMEKWGAPITPAEHDTLRGYLLAKLGPRPTKKP